MTTTKEKLDRLKEVSATFIQLTEEKKKELIDITNNFMRKRRRIEEQIYFQNCLLRNVHIEKEKQEKRAKNLTEEASREDNEVRSAITLKECLSLQDNPPILIPVVDYSVEQGGIAIALLSEKVGFLVRTIAPSWNVPYEHNSFFFFFYLHYLRFNVVGVELKYQLVCPCCVHYFDNRMKFTKEIAAEQHLKLEELWEQVARICKEAGITTLFVSRAEAEYVNRNYYEKRYPNRKPREIPDVHLVHGSTEEVHAFTKSKGLIVPSWCADTGTPMR
jgi:hypothetical protein